MVAFTYSMPAGIAGAVSRADFSVVETGLYDSSYAFASYGLPAKIVSGKARPLASGDDVSLVTAFLVRPYPGHAASQSDPLGGGTPSTSGICNLLKRGYMTVKNNAGTPAAEGQVYIRVANASAGKPIGGIEAAADSTNTVVIPNCVFKGAADSSGNVEIAYKM